jgi:hypothetical protein
MKATTIDIGGRREVRIGCYELDHGDGDPPSLRVFISCGWQGVGLLPFAQETVDLPLAVLPELRAALDALEAEK